jgi:hypothetical protein
VALAALDAALDVRLAQTVRGEGGGSMHRHEMSLLVGAT